MYLNYSFSDNKCYSKNAVFEICVYQLMLMNNSIQGESNYDCFVQFSE